MRDMTHESTKNLLELSTNRDFPGSRPVRMKYAILSSPRSGSTLLSRMLHATGMAGDPLEYLSIYLLELERKRTGNQSLTLTEFLNAMTPRRTSQNGVFGMQIHYSQFIAAFSSDAMQRFIGGFDKLIWVRRRDRMRQAVSMAIARKTRAWSSEETLAVAIDDPAAVHPIDCVHALSIVCKNDFGWEQLITDLSLDVLVIWYEDLVQDYPGESAKTLRHLGLDAAVTQIPEPVIHRQSSALNDLILESTLAYVGISGSVRSSMSNAR